LEKGLKQDKPKRSERLFEAIGNLDKRASHVEDMATIYHYSGLRRMEVYKLHKDWVHLIEGEMGILVIPQAIEIHAQVGFS